MDDIYTACGQVSSDSEVQIYGWRIDKEGWDVAWSTT